MKTDEQNHLRQSGEDYLKTILILHRKKEYVRSADVAKYLNVTRPSVSNAIRLLQEGGYLRMDENKMLYLTQAGRDAAERVCERHRILKNALVSIGVDPEIADQDACRIEHVISRESFAKVKELLEKRTREQA
ncbi:MAG: metal-dependent transcriptional regulator [Oscillospiraceae bacterium]|nr:metal-dependent transcriptional regulator [Oscillospiraceae bacterium]